MKTFLRTYILLSLSLLLLTFNVLAQKEPATRTSKSKQVNSNYYSPRRAVHLVKEVEYKALGRIGRNLLESFVDKERNVICYFFRKTKSEEVGSMECLPIKSN